MSDDDTPIEEQNYLYGINVVDIADIRVARGRAKREQPNCRHRRLMYDQDERRVFCDDCKKTIDNFDAFMNLVNVFSSATAKIDKKEKELNDALKYNIRRLAAKKMDEAWLSKTMIPCCPHCKTGLLPEDALNITSYKSKELEIARRKKAENQNEKS